MREAAVAVEEEKAQNRRLKRLWYIYKIAVSDTWANVSVKVGGRGCSSPKILAGGIVPISPFITESIFSVLRNGKNTTTRNMGQSPT